MTGPDDQAAGFVVLTSVPIVDEIFDHYRPWLGDDFNGYRNHVYRVVNLCLRLVGDNGGDTDKIAVAAVFHDLGIWTAHTFDYIPPSIALAREHLVGRSKAEWIPEVEAMIVNHHKITRADSHRDRLVEPFRRADWIDVTRGVRSFGLQRPFIESLFATWPSAGFHWRLVELTMERFRRHPLSPLPMVKL